VQVTVDVDAFAVRAKPIIEKLAAARNIKEPAAVALYGHLIGISGHADMSFAACSVLIDHISKKSIPELSQEEIRVGLILGFVRHLQKPYLSVTAGTGRNAPCPCKSGLKYKNCCLSSNRKLETQVLEDRRNPK
jgi:hypothetical protein